MKIGTIILVLGLVFIGSIFGWIYYENHTIHQLEFQVNCNPEDTHCRVSSEDTKGNEYGLFAENVCYQEKSCINYTLSKGNNCTILSISDMEEPNAPLEWRYGHLGDMQVKYSYQVLCYSMGTLKLEEAWK